MSACLSKTMNLTELQFSINQTKSWIICKSKKPYVVPQSREPTNSPCLSDIFLRKKEEKREGLGRAFILRLRPHERSTVHLGTNSDMHLLALTP